MKINLLDITAYYINLEDEPERNENIKTLLGNLGFKDVVRVDGIRHPFAGIVGLSQANHKILSTAKAPFIIFEDDIQVRGFSPEIIVPDDADAVYLGNTSWAVQNSFHGHFLRYRKSNKSHNLYRVFNMLCAHAILYLSDRYVSACERTSYYCGYVSPVPVDVPFAEIQKYYNVYTTNVPMFTQMEFEGRMSDTPKSTQSNLLDIKNNFHYLKHGRKTMADPLLDHPNVNPLYPDLL